MTTEERQRILERRKSNKFYQAMETFLGQNTSKGQAQQKALKGLNGGLNKMMMIAIGIGSVVAFGVWGLFVVVLIVAATSGSKS